jgi:hypothetical protein
MTLDLFTSASRDASVSEVMAIIGLGDGEGFLLTEQPDVSRAFFSDGGSVFFDPNAIRGAAAP